MKPKFIFPLTILIFLVVQAKDDNPETGCPATVTDADGNVYNTVMIGTQCWMKENLSVSGGIPNVPDNGWDMSQWGPLIDPAWCYYDDNPSYGVTYGKLYNWYAVATGSLCPSGWHIPTDGEWQQLVGYLGGDAVAGGAMKATSGWKAPNTGATNSSGFTALPGGCRISSYGGYFSGVGASGFFWSSTESNTHNPWYRILNYNDSIVNRNSFVSRGDWFSCRCLRNYTKGS